jgi:hypothetical protein
LFNFEYLLKMAENTDKKRDREDKNKEETKPKLAP